ncbi:hypothetical protein WISP_61888 [Willisornis vidua]|uniref:Uncharacterized protein n=1 Tax=Willisornis vidua TaxID=1566151 RepID=A0ABQ9DAA2_9PASS|nr:hypothetical protein WISP_61888 [Willisornis vidua]
MLESRLCRTQVEEHEVENSDEWGSQVLVWGLALSTIFVRTTDSAIKFADDTELYGTVNMLEGWNATWTLTGLRDGTV